MNYLADTITIVRHFSGAGRIGRAARVVLEGVERGENDLFLSSISLVEILYPEIFDRLIISTAQYLGVPLITSDQGIRESGFVETIWS